VSFIVRDAITSEQAHFEECYYYGTITFGFGLDFNRCYALFLFILRYSITVRFLPDVTLGYVHFGSIDRYRICIY